MSDTPAREATPRAPVGDVAEAATREGAAEPAPRFERSAGRTGVVALAGAFALVLGLSFMVFRAFLVDLTVAGSVAILLWPVHRRLTRLCAGRGFVSAAILVVSSVALLLIPILLSATLLGQQGIAFFEWVRPKLQPAELRRVIEELPQRWPWLGDLSRIDADATTQLVSAALSRLVGGLNGLVQGVVAALTEALLDVLLTAFILFFLLRDGAALKIWARRISPLSAREEDEILDHLGRTVKGVLQSMVIVPIAQGLVALPGFLLLGLPSPVLWSFAVMLASFVPLLGSPLAWLPAVGYAYMYLSPATALLVLVYSFVFISGIDNIVKPLVLRGVAKVHPLLAFLAILGGIGSFGPSGLLIGPVILSLLLSALRLYENMLAARRYAGAPAPPIGESADARNEPGDPAGLAVP